MSRVTTIGRLHCGWACRAQRKMAQLRPLSLSARTWQAKKQGKQDDTEVEKLYYYEIPGNKLNPHSYFYRVLAVPYLKFCGIIIATYYGMTGLWQYLEWQEEKNAEVGATK